MMALSLEWFGHLPKVDTNDSFFNILWFFDED